MFLLRQKQPHLIEATGCNSAALRADVGDSRQVRAIAEEIKRKFGRLDVIINNAGIAKDPSPLKQTELEWDSIIRTNLTGCFHVIRTLSPLMIRIRRRAYY